MSDKSKTYGEASEDLVKNLHQWTSTALAPMPRVSWGPVSVELRSIPMPAVLTISPRLEQLLDRALAKSAFPGASASRTVANKASLMRSLVELLGWSMTDSAEVLRPAALPAVMKLIADLTIKEQRRWDLASAARWWSARLEADWPDPIAGTRTDAKADHLHKQRALKTELRKAIERARLSQRAVAEQAEVPLASLERWLRGSLPDSRSAGGLQRLESTLGLARGTLLKLISHRLDASTPEKVKTSYGEYLKSCRAKKYIMSDSEISAALRRQFTELVVHQTTGFPKLPRTSSSPWKTHPEAARGTLRWFNTANGEYCPSADAVWRRMSSFLSWLANIGPAGGAPLGVDAAQTLAWLAVPEAVEGYLRWHVGRASGHNNGARNFCQIVQWLTAPRTGWLRQHPNYALGLPEAHRPSCWDEACDAVLQYTRAQQRANKADADGETHRTRDPFEGLAYYIRRDDPGEPILQAIEALLLEADALAPDSSMRGIRLRDAALLSFLLLLPVRLETGAKLRISGAQANVTFEGPVMQVRIPARLLKNGGVLGRIKVDIESDLCGVIARYVREGRSLLLAGQRDPGFLFVSSGNLQGDPWGGLSESCVAITTRLCEGHGIPTHSMRHLVATRYLRLHPGDYLGVAALLHDRLPTVIRTYAPKDPTGAFPRNSKSLRLDA